MPATSATKVNKPTVKRLLKGMGINPVGLAISKNNWWQVTPSSASDVEVIKSGLTNQGIRFCEYPATRFGNATIVIYL